MQWGTAVQHHVPAKALSPVCACDALGALAINPIGQALAGPAMIAFGLGGAIALSAETLAVLLVRDVRAPPRHVSARRDPAARSEDYLAAG